MGRVYDDIIDFIAGGSTPEEVAAFRPSEATRERVFELLAKKKDGTLTEGEASDLGRFLELEHMMRLAKRGARAAQAMSHVPASLRRLVAARAEGLCEYCLIHEDDSYFGCEIEHVISEKHDGRTVAENLAYACAFCNSHKGTDIAARDAKSGALVPLFNPRTDRWSEHFAFRLPGIEPLTAVGAATIRILQLNHPDRVVERDELARSGRYPTPAAAARMR